MFKRHKQSVRQAGKRSAEDFAEEIRAHLELEADEIASEGKSAEEAARRARASFGSVAAARERFALRGRAVWLEDLVQDVRFALRVMLRNRAFTAIVVLTLAIGLAVSVTAFSWIDAVLIQPLSGVTEPGRLVTLESVMPNGDWVPNSYPDYIDFRDRLKLLDGIVASHPVAFTVGQEERAERVRRRAGIGQFFRRAGREAGAGTRLLACGIWR